MKNSVLYLMLLVLAACSNNEPKEGKVAADSSGKTADTLIVSTKNSQKLDTVDVSFLQQAAYGGMVEVESSNKILSLTKNADIKAFAEMMVNDHGKANEQLKSLAQGKGYALPAALPQSKIEAINKMDSFKDEGRNEYYLLLMVNEHKNAVNIFSLASRSADKEINTFAKGLLPILKHHLMEVEKLDSLYKVPKANQGDDPLKLSDRKKQKG